MPLAPMLVSFLCELVMAFVLLNLLAALHAGSVPAGAYTGLIIGIGFLATTTLVNHLFPGRKLLLSVIDGGHWIFVAAIQGGVLAAR